MKTILVSGNDTGIGKTWTVGSLARILCERGYSVQIVKPVQTGVSSEEETDAAIALERCGRGRARSVVLRCYAAPLSPACAAALEGKRFEFDELAEDVCSLSPVDVRIVEGAGSLAVPFDDSGRDWVDFAKAVGADKLLLVVEDRLGAIGQARMVYSYAKSKGMDAGLWLNQMKACDEETLHSNHNTLRVLGLPMWGRQAFEVDEPELICSFWED